MTMRRRDCLLTLAAGPWLAGAHAQTPPELGGLLRSVSLLGRKKFTVFGFSVYDASLWVEPGFDPQNYSRHGFALDLLYRRDFTNADITRRSPMQDDARHRWRTSANRPGRPGCAARFRTCARGTTSPASTVRGSVPCSLTSCPDRAH